MAVPELKSARELREEAEVVPVEVPEIDPRDSVEYKFEFSYADMRGKLWAGKFTNRILTVGQKRAVKLLKARLAGGVSVVALDADVWELNEILAHMAYSLDAKVPGFPDWAKNLEGLYDEGIIYALWKEVDGHEARFRRRGPPGQASSDTAGDAGG
jgi:hypothetical protein